MFIIKIGGSLIAPKDKEIFTLDNQYLEQISSIIKDRDGIFIHGAGNVGHGLVKKYGLTESNAPWLSEQLAEFYGLIDKYFPGFTRIAAKNLIVDKFNPGFKKIISGGDIDDNLRVVSGDEIFAHLYNFYDLDLGYMLTDVDGVLDEDNNIIPELSLDNLDNIKFWSKDGDINGAMKCKINWLFTSIHNNTGKDKIIWIVNGKNLDNFQNLLSGKKGVGTKVIIKSD